MYWTSVVSVLIINTPDIPMWCVSDRPLLNISSKVALVQFLCTSVYNFYVQNWHHLPTISEVFGYKVSSYDRDGALEYLRHIRVYVDGSRLHAADHVISHIRFIARYSLLYQVIKRLE